MEKIRIGVIGGTGIYKLPGISEMHKETIETEYGQVNVNIGNLGGKAVAFLTRHGEGHSTSPGQINYRSNIRAMQILGVKQIFATACSGSLNPKYGAGSFVLLNQFLDFTKNRPASFFYNDGSEDRKIAHVDLTKPYCKRLEKVILEAGEKLGIEVNTGATYCCQEGPRFETEAEIKMFRALGGDLVAHTQYPEVALAREAEICYAAIAIVSNMAAGVEDEHVSATELTCNMSQLFENVQALLAKSVELLEEDDDCWCKHALEDAFL